MSHNLPNSEVKAKRLERLKHVERLILLPILVLAAGAFFSVGRADVVGQSMFPTLKSGQRLVILKAWRSFSSLKEGDIVVIGAREGKASRDLEVVKRIVFLQNATGTRPWPAQITTPTGTYLTEALFKDSLVNRSTPRGIYVLGDNINNSTDSRDFGAVYASEILGKVIK